ncbi:MAG: DNA-3-methyladenine glycosylase I [Armatimonadetes bacterium]|nr:DNA-3-methyladenine glycosylase I [Anaerolineae bacterium]
MTTDVSLPRCAWVSLDVPIYVQYHDTEWAVPVHDEHALFERLCLEGAQAGLSWLTVLRKREAYRAAFDDFDPERVARYDDVKIAELMTNAGIIRNRLKINAAISNAQRFIAVQTEFGSFDRYLWAFVDGKTIQNHWHTQAEVPSINPLSDSMSKDLVKRGFKFVGSTICYAMLQACGLVNDHLLECFRYDAIKQLSEY